MALGGSCLVRSAPYWAPLPYTPSSEPWWKMGSFCCSQSGSFHPFLVWMWLGPGGRGICLLMSSGMQDFLCSCLKYMGPWVTTALMLIDLEQNWIELATLILLYGKCCLWVLYKEYCLLSLFSVICWQHSPFVSRRHSFGVLILAHERLLLTTAFRGRTPYSVFFCLLLARLPWHGPDFKMTFPFSLPILESFCSTSSDGDLGLSKMNVVWFSL